LGKNYQDELIAFSVVLHLVVLFMQFVIVQHLFVFGLLVNGSGPVLLQLQLPVLDGHPFGMLLGHELYAIGRTASRQRKHLLRLGIHDRNGTRRTLGTNQRSFGR